MDFAQARSEALAKLQSLNHCRKLSDKELAICTVKPFAEVWLVRTEVFNPDDEILTLNLLVGLPLDFPLVLPTVYLDQKDYLSLRYLPHVDTQGLVCTYDPETVQVSPNDPFGIVKSCIDKARKIIQDGLAKANTNDFQQEFVAYWGNQYLEEEEVGVGLVLTDEALPTGVNSIIHLTKKRFGGHNLILPAAEGLTPNFKDVLQRHGIETQTVLAFHLGELGDIEPPFNLNNGKVLELVRQHFPNQLDSFQDFLRKSTILPPLAIFHRRLAGKVRYFGWVHPLPRRKKKGFRPSKLATRTALSFFESAQKVSRLRFDTLTNRRQVERTAGEAPKHEYKFLLAGLGSIGSNLIYYMDSFPVRELRLVDPDRLKLENIPRHLLSIDYIHGDKVEGLQHYLELQKPLRPVSIRPESIAQVAIREPNYLNECDAIILAIGRNSVEQNLLDLQAGGVLTRPIIIIWVEPYLTGGHLLYFPCGHGIDYVSLYDNGYYKYNVVGMADYRKPDNQMLLKEAGCQTSYAPYSQEYVTLFLSRLFPELRSLIRAPSPDAWAFTWLGNDEAIKQQKFSLSTFASGIKEGELIKTKL